MFDAEPQGRGAVELSLVVFRPPYAAGASVDLERSIEHDTGRRVSVVERRRIYERLERRTRLALCLRGPIELALIVGKAANHRENPPGLGIHGDNCAGYFRHLPQSEHPLLAGQRLDV